MPSTDPPQRPSRPQVFCVILERDLLVGTPEQEARFRPLRRGIPGLLAWATGKGDAGDDPPDELPYRGTAIRTDRLEDLLERRRSGCRIVLMSGLGEEEFSSFAGQLDGFDLKIREDRLRDADDETILAVANDHLGDGLENAGLYPPAKRASITDWLRLMRVHQWSKNVLLFIPLMASHRVQEGTLFLDSLRAFGSFCLGASSIYILNDIIDLPADRRHPSKRQRPLAAGLIDPTPALRVSAMLILLSLGMAAMLPARFLMLLAVYLITSLTYSIELKRRVLVDVFCLAGLYTLRILAGGAATSIVISPWLMAFSMFLFLSLAFVKRYTELDTLVRRGEHQQVAGRGYHTDDLALIRSVGPASGYLAALVICLYVNDQKSVAIYRSPSMLWLLCPVLLYWITRVWFVAQRGGMDSDPVVFAVTDPKSQLAGAICAGILAAATWL